VIHDLPVIRLVHIGQLAGIGGVDQIEQQRKGMAQTETAPATVTDIVNRSSSAKREPEL